MVRLLILAISTSFASGCITCNHHACESALAPAEAQDDRCRSDRSRVHVFIINGDEPFHRDHLARLQRELNAAGYCQISCGGLFYVSRFETTIGKIHCNDPDAKFILVGQGLGVSSVDGMAARLSTSGIPIEGVVALSPCCLPGFETAPGHEVRRMVITIRDAVGTPLNDRDSAYQVESGNTYPDEAATAGLILTMVREATAAIPKGDGEVVAVLPLIDNPAPRPRMNAVTVPLPPTKVPVKGILTSQPKP